MNQLIHFNRARQELALATSIDEVKDIRDKAEALRAYAKQAGESLQMQNQCAEIKIRAERRAGELIPEEFPHGGDRKSESRSQDDTLIDSGITKMQSHRWQTMAELPEENFERYIAETKEKGEELTSIGIYKKAQKHKQSQHPNIDTPSLPNRKYQTLIVDPPWPVQKILRDVRPNQDVFDYPKMSIDEIMNFPIQEITADNAHLYLWTTHKYLPDALMILNGWGFNYQCLLTWIKNVGITPFSWMYSTELVLFGRKGNLPLLKNGKRLDFQGKVREHSRKPDEFYDKVRLVSPEPRIDIFSREEREGFEQYGNQIQQFSN